MNKLKSLLLIEQGEGGQVAFYLALFVCLGAGMAIGKGSADAMFLKRYGIEYLPVMYLVLSGVLATTFIAYAAFVDRLSPERFFYTLLVLQAVLLTFFWYAIVFTENDVIYPAYFLLYELVSEMILVHAVFYIGQNLDTLQSKRLMPIIFSGYQTGMIIGGSFLAFVIPEIGVENSPLIWGLLVGISVSLLLIWHKRKGVSPYYHPPAKSKRKHIETAIKEVRHGLRFMKESELLKYSSFALFFLVITFYVLSFSVNKIYSESFDTEEALTAFFGVLVALTNLSALLLQIFVSNRVVERFGVSRTKMIFPFSAVISFLLLLFTPGFYMAMFASFSKDSIMPAFRNPTRQMYFNVLPDHVRGRARAMQIAIVMPIALFICGSMIWYLQYASDMALIFTLGLVCATFYLFYCYKMGKVYVSALLASLKGRLFLPVDTIVANFSGGNKKIYKALLDGLNNSDGRVCLSYASLLIKAFPSSCIDDLIKRLKAANNDIADQIVRLIGLEADEKQREELVEYLNVGDNHLRATIYEVVITTSGNNCTELIQAALNDHSPRVRSAGIIGVVTRKETSLFEEAFEIWNKLVEEEHEDDQMAAISLISFIKSSEISDKNTLIKRYSQMCSDVLGAIDEERRIALYKHIQHWEWGLTTEAFDIVREDLLHLNTELRMAATRCLYLLPSKHDRKACLWKALADGHSGVRKVAMDVFNKLYSDPLKEYFEWVVKNTPGTSRAQQTLVKTMIKKGMAHNKLEKIVNAKIKYASVILGAVQVLAKVESNVASFIVVRSALEERLIQTVDLALLALEPVMEKGVISVIRAGLNSRDSRQIANAREALLSLESKRAVKLLSCLIGKDYINARKTGFVQVFDNVTEVLSWCARGSDEWLSECGTRAIQEVKI